MGDRRSDGLPDIGIGIETEEKLPKDPADTPVNQVTPQQTALNGTSNLSDLNGNWLTRQGMVIMFSSLFIVLSTSLSNKNKFCWSCTKDTRSSQIIWQTNKK